MSEAGDRVNGERPGLCWQGREHVWGLSGAAADGREAAPGEGRHTLIEWRCARCGAVEYTDSDRDRRAS